MFSPNALVKGEVLSTPDTIPEIGDTKTSPLLTLSLIDFSDSIPVFFIAGMNTKAVLAVDGFPLAVNLSKLLLESTNTVPTPVPISVGCSSKKDNIPSL